ncbi:MAG TPA: PIG-L family deacetylase [Lacunisphaera sp.]|nr:PIG-L family deacetylase [Lacunisphaera sp.]
MRRAAILAGVALLTLSAGAAQTPLADGNGQAILGELKSFDTTATILHVGAHPDDENTQLIAYFSRGRGYRTGYLSVTRGDGGQNELGPEFDEKLGVARTQELLAARKVDGGRQFFTRAIDFGFTKSPEETFQFWNHQEILSDVVRVIRRFRPDVIVTRFPIPPGSGGHGQHTASAILAVEAFKLAGDPTAFPDQIAEGLQPWQPRRIFWNSWGDPARSGLNGPVFKLDIGGDDPVTGEPFGTIANRSRGMHKTQGLGGFSNRGGGGPNVQSFMLLAGDPPSASGADLFDGIDATWNRVPGGAEIGRMTDEAIAQFKPGNPAASVPAVLAIRSKLAALPSDPLVEAKRAQLDRLLQDCLGLKVETTVDRAEVVPGETVTLKYTINLAAPNVRVRHLETTSPALTLTGDGAADMAAGSTLVGKVSGILPDTTAVSQPYWLRADGSTGVYRVEDPHAIGTPENGPVMPVHHVFSVEGQTLVVTDQPVQLLAGASAAQARRPLTVIPPLSMQFGSDIYLVAPGTTKVVSVELTAARAETHGSLRLEKPEGWLVEPATEPFQLATAGDKARFEFKVTSPAGTSSGRIMAVAKIDGREYSNERYEIRYSHIPVQLLQPPARARVASFPLATRGFTVGYLPGAGDAVAECMEQMGYVVHQLTGADLTPEKLKGLDAVVLGVRAFNERSDLKDALPGLFAWVEAGGTVIAQYNRPDRKLAAEQLGPYPISIAGPAPQLRVTDERAPVTFIAADSPALNAPNKIAPSDFEGWVQERGAYFPSKWDEEHYTALLAMSDPGEAPLRSSVLVAQYGKGHYVYTGLAFFRQLPAGVPGAYRLFANLLALGK